MSLWYSIALFAVNYNFLGFFLFNRSERKALSLRSTSQRCFDSILNNTFLNLPLAFLAGLAVLFYIFKNYSTFTWKRLHNVL
ncbi:MAG TPA: hypothetical protein DHV15_07185 [Treponema sp.]|uniref:Uncharacterized protein n=1 Tax=Treponema denticola (strain ATCC 35405 / DSM 14222 / CIP 103919 / JCM 8153 / KCTC 15104) TaxID=243275 RepID=Q73KA5_TREDE|nr:hypothetical protein TDE_2314 [Treponema denticola ATCC 35405]HCY95282.1 hypothetical protein [Treponema sp.]